MNNTTKDEFGIVFNNKYQAWYIIYKTKDSKEYKIDTKAKIRPDKHNNDCIPDDFLQRVKDIANMGYIFNPYMSITYCDIIEWF